MTPLNWVLVSIGNYSAKDSRWFFKIRPASNGEWCLYAECTDKRDSVTCRHFSLESAKDYAEFIRARERNDV